MFNKEHPGLKVLAYNALRVVAGLLYAQHGAQKLFGVLEGNQAELMSLMGLAGIIEFFGGLLIAAGLFTRPVAFVACGQMAVAYFMAHAPQGFWPILNRGELAAFYCFTWLFFFTHGPGRYSVDGWLAGRKAEE
ncbi:MAG: DoxX family protein [Gemmatimonadota bacterium]|nr:DoxX family protein [Gemmatimonadota bacterium]MDE2865343.1 DoxX family protein [Gemmatimonadota bacterium]MXV94481.1 DoxX family protein [Gemmatimonadota bacterium]MYB05484.1 DoxX family protein [Gemmatimonadota bacterium]MYE17159.1 DoxX family protein [Gemmatimonadota bacterium]